MITSTLAQELRNIADSIDATHKELNPQNAQQADEVDAMAELDLRMALGDLAVVHRHLAAQCQKEYRFEHITDLIQLSEVHVEQFCSELPTLIDTLKSSMTLLQGLDLDPAVASKIIPYITWKADNYDAVVLALKAGDMELGTITLEGDHDDR